MSGFLFDSNVLLDIITANVTWRAWSKAQLATATAQRLTLINPLIYAELAPAFVLQDELDRWLGPADFQRLPPPYSAGWQVGPGFRVIPLRGRYPHLAAAGLPHRARRGHGSDVGNARRGAVPSIFQASY